MAQPLLHTIESAIYARLNGDLVATYAGSVWSGNAPPDKMPGQDDFPIVVFEAGCTADDTDSANVSFVTVRVYVISHTDASREAMRTVGARVYGDGSTYGLHRWKPTISGVGTSPIAVTNQDKGSWDETHISELYTFETYITEGS